MSWIPMALSTLRPVTSPRLSVIELGVTSSRGVSVETVITDFRRIAEEIARIEREFEGAVTFTVVPDSRVRVVLDTLNVRFSFVGRRKSRGHADSSSSVRYSSSSVTSVEMGRLPLPLAFRRSLSSFSRTASWACGVDAYISPPRGSLSPALAARLSLH